MDYKKKIIKTKPTISLSCLMPVSHCGELGLRVYYEYWRVITRQKIREFAIISHDCDKSATPARVLFVFVRDMYDNRQINTSLHDIPTMCVRHPHDKRILLYENIRV